MVLGKNDENIKNKKLKKNNSAIYLTFATTSSHIILFIRGAYCYKNSFIFGGTMIAKSWVKNYLYGYMIPSYPVAMNS